MSHKKTFFEDEDDDEDEYDSSFALSAMHDALCAPPLAFSAMLSAFVRLSSEFCNLSSVFVKSQIRNPKSQM
jgi:hypothetical protein